MAKFQRMETDEFSISRKSIPLGTLTLEQEGTLNVTETQPLSILTSTPTINKNPLRSHFNTENFANKKFSFLQSKDDIP